MDMAVGDAEGGRPRNLILGAMIFAVAMTWAATEVGPEGQDSSPDIATAGEPA
jgi:hypothetical protein